MQIMIKLICSIFVFSNNFFINFFTYVKLSKDSSAKHYQNNKERLQGKAREKYQSLSKEEKEKKQQYGHERYENLPEDEKQKLVEYRKNTIKWEKTPYYNYNYKTLLF